MEHKAGSASCLERRGFLWETGRILIHQPTSKTSPPASARAEELKVPEEIRQLRSANLVALVRPMSLDPSFEQIFDQTDSAPNPAPAQRALLVVASDGRIQFATPQANLWMRNFFTAAAPLDRLPEVLTRWLCDGISGGQPSKFIVDQPGRRTCIQVLCREANSVCLLLEQYPGSRASNGKRCALTERQTEVLSWVACGKTNEEIGKILSLKTGTIGKYLERIFPKLGVENRTAAAGGDSIASAVGTGASLECLG
jgi:DNA-binding CsgD family transcriptional regulator